MSDAVGLQADQDHTGKLDPDLTDILIVSVVLAMVLRQPGPRSVEMLSVYSFHRLGLTAQNCADILKQAEYQLGSLHSLLGCSQVPRFSSPRRSI